MLKNLLNKKRQEGFSIVEVMIVLAIAGLIILVVFLAVPALQRNSRNTTKKTAASNVASLVSEYQSANGGKNPTTAALSGGTLTIGAGNSVNSTIGNAFADDANVLTGGPGTGLDAIQIVVGQKCTDAASHTTAANARSVAVLYNVETASGAAAQCIEA